jgi:hypothetical protein
MPTREPDIMPLVTFVTEPAAAPFSCTSPTSATPYRFTLDDCAAAYIECPPAPNATAAPSTHLANIARFIPISVLILNFLKYANMYEISKFLRGAHEGASQPGGL